MSPQALGDLASERPAAGEFQSRDLGIRGINSHVARVTAPGAE